jgi:hypothetical protein
MPCSDPFVRHEARCAGAAPSKIPIGYSSRSLQPFTTTDHRNPPSRSRMTLAGAGLKKKKPAGESGLLG